ncbi:class I SAM-dependent methyltransferase [Kitasatospora sp. NPDC048239]|uniref:class I SAM-dependent methyltransferase n=1 Tax=Kitasatospora sp. NPDC048239 TaxID=3364046 RepID=UPI0037146A71
MNTPDEWAKRARSYGPAASLYEVARPSYPEPAIREIVSRLPGPTLVEPGAGTGKATRLFAARGVQVTCVEPDLGMATVLLRANADAGVRGVGVHVESFEDWRPPYRSSGLVCAQAWHWFDQERCWAKAAETVAPGGLLALLWNVERWDVEQWGETPARSVIERVFARHGQEARDDGGLGPAVWPTEPTARRHGFQELELLTYDWEQDWEAADFAAYRATTSQLLVLPDGVRDDLVKDLESALLRELGGSFTLPWRTYLFLARRSAADSTAAAAGPQRCDPERG